jgi:hypothetical protein
MDIRSQSEPCRFSELREEAGRNSRCVIGITEEMQLQADIQHSA